MADCKFLPLGTVFFYIIYNAKHLTGELLAGRYQKSVRQVGNIQWSVVPSGQNRKFILFCLVSFRFHMRLSAAFSSPFRSFFTQTWMDYSLPFSPFWTRMSSVLISHHSSLRQTLKGISTWKSSARKT